MSWRDQNVHVQLREAEEKLKREAEQRRAEAEAELKKRADEERAERTSEKLILIIFS